MTEAAAGPPPVDGRAWGDLSLELVVDAPSREIASAPDTGLRLVLVTSGSYVIESARPRGAWERAVMAPGRTAATPPGREIRARWAASGAQVLRSTHVRIPSRVLEDVGDALPGPSSPDRLDFLSRDDGYATAAVEELTRAARLGAPALLADSVAVALVAHLLSLPPTAPAAREPGLAAADLATALSLMHARLADPLSLTDLAASVHMSRYHFLRRFTASIGRTPMRYVTDQRMQLARSLLARTGIGVAAIAVRCGYATPAAFASAFRRHHGISPSAYRSQSG